MSLKKVTIFSLFFLSQMLMAKGELSLVEAEFVARMQAVMQYVENDSNLSNLAAQFGCKVQRKCASDSCQMFVTDITGKSGDTVQIVTSTLMQSCRVSSKISPQAFLGTPIQELIAYFYQKDSSFVDLGTKRYQFTRYSRVPQLYCCCYSIKPVAHVGSINNQAVE